MEVAHSKGVLGNGKKAPAYETGKYLQKSVTREEGKWVLEKKKETKSRSHKRTNASDSPMRLREVSDGEGKDGSHKRQL